MARPSFATAPTSAAKPPRLKHTFWWYLKWCFIVLTLALFCLLVVVACVGKGLYDELSKKVPDIRLVMQRQKTEPTRVYAINGSLLAEFKGDERSWISIEELRVWRNRNGVMRHEPGRLIDATLSIEDARFYRHPGMDAKRLLGALVANIKSGDVQQGGSTITEQLAKNVYLSRAKTVSRRLNTALLALQLERKLSKDEILEAYLNSIFYGNRATGCEAASQIYFGKSASQLDIAEASFLAGLPQSPTRFDPFDHFDRAKKRQEIVLHEMLQNKRITYPQYIEAKRDTSIKTKIEASQRRVFRERAEVAPWKAPYFVSYVKSYLEKQYGWSEEELTKSGYKIYTSLDPKIQAIAEQKLISSLNRLGRSGLQGALVCIDPQTGQVIAMVGGRDFYDTRHNGQWNRAVQGKRQPGSTMKPYIYATAMEAGMTPDSVLVDSPLYICGDSECTTRNRSRRRRNTEIRNYDRIHHGAMTLRNAMGQSNNVIACRTMLKVGIQNVIQKAHQMGIQSALVPVPTLALGTSEISLLEHVSAYGVFAARGLRAEATPVVKIVNYAGEIVVQQPEQVRGARVLSQGAANAIWSMLRYVVTDGTGKNANISGVEVGGKTGTTSSNKDVWFMGATKDLVAGVWMGYDRPRELYGSAGGRWCAPVWRSFMVSALDEWAKRDPVKKLVEDARATTQRRMVSEQYKQYVSVRICDDSGLLATKVCPNSHMEKFSAAAGAPTQYCDIHVPKTAQPEQKRPKAGDVGADPPLVENPIPGRDQSEPDTPIESPRNNGSSGTVLPEDGLPPDDFSPPPAPGDNGEVARRSTARSSPEREVVRTICIETGDIAGPNCPATAQQTFMASQAPTRKCRVHR